jgi:hypothetical protein
MGNRIPVLFMSVFVVAEPVGLWVPRMRYPSNPQAWAAWAGSGGAVIDAGKADRAVPDVVAARHGRRHGRPQPDISIRCKGKLPGLSEAVAAPSSAKCDAPGTE